MQVEEGYVEEEGVRLGVEEGHAQVPAQEAVMPDKRYVAHVTFLSRDCPEPWDEFNAMDWDERRPLLERYARHATLTLVCPGSKRDVVLGRVLEALLAANPGYEVVYQTVPACDGWADEGEDDGVSWDSSLAIAG